MRGKAASASSLAGAARAFGRHYVRYSFGLSYLVFWCSSYRWVGLLKGLVIVAVRRFAIAWVSGGDGFSSGLYDSLKCFNRNRFRVIFSNSLFSFNSSLERFYWELDS